MTKTNCACGKILSRLTGEERKFEFGKSKLNISDGWEPTMCRECAIKHSRMEISRVIALDEQGGLPIVNWRSYLQFENKPFINEILGDLKILSGITGWMVMSANDKCVNPRNKVTIFFFTLYDDAEAFGLIQAEECKIMHRAKYLQCQPGKKVDWRSLESLLNG